MTNIIEAIDTFCSEYEKGQENRYLNTVFVFQCFAKSLGIDVNHGGETQRAVTFEFYKNSFLIVTKSISVTD